MEDSFSQTDSDHHDSHTNCVHDDDDNNKCNIRSPIGLDSFDTEAQEAFGHELRIFMAFKDGSAIPPESDHFKKAMPDKAPAIALRLKQLGQDIASGTADQLELLVRYDDLGGWKPSGFRHCVAWMNLEIGISFPLGWEYLRVGRKLRSLPITRALFRAGKLTWSIVRLLSRVADKSTEARLCHAALDASVSDVERFCNEFRWQQQANAKSSENARSLQQIDARSFNWNTVNNGNTLIKLSLPPEVAQAFLNSVEQSLAQLENSEATMTQRRADAAVLMAENSLQNAGRDMATADRYQVIVSVDSSELSQRTQSELLQNTQSDPSERPRAEAPLKATPLSATPLSEAPLSEAPLSEAPLSEDPLSEAPLPEAPLLEIPHSMDLQAKSSQPEAQQSRNNQTTATQAETPEKRATVRGAGPIATETARRIACDCSVTTIKHTNGEPIDIGRKSRLWPPAMARAIKNRDQHCQFPGCHQSRHLQIHHIHHWADGGSTCLNNGVCLCVIHHALVHEGNHRIERINNLQNAIEEQFARQQATEHTVNEVETLLRNSRESFERVRTLSPTRFRFRVVNQDGMDIRDVEEMKNANLAVETTDAEARSTRVERETCDQWMGVYNDLTSTIDWPGVAETAGHYMWAEMPGEAACSYTRP